MEEPRPAEANDLLMMRALASRMLPDAASEEQMRADDDGMRLVDEREEFVHVAYETFARLPQHDILRRAIDFTIPVGDERVENSFICLFAALESVLTFFRRAGDYDVLPREDFSRLERDLRKWLKSHPLLQHESAKRGLIYEKLKELNRFPFSYVFESFCEQNRVDLTDLWPLVGRPAEWPLAEIRHRLIHGDPFTSLPRAALVCARAHLRWTVERMLVAVLGWPVERTSVGADALARTSEHYRNWQAERARLA